MFHCNDQSHANHLARGSSAALLRLGRGNRSGADWGDSNFLSGLASFALNVIVLCNF
jgi:hypothetical protein